MTGLNLDEMLARVTTLNATNTTQARTYLTDALGSVMAQTQDNQSTLAGYSYSPYGQTQSTGNTEGDSVQYTGRENDNNGLYYYRARYYDPVLKRFLSEDPIGLAGGSLSFYAYVNGNPVSLTDPTGEFALVGAGIGAALNLGAQMGTCLALGGDFLTCLKCVDVLDVALSAVKGGMGVSLLKLGMLYKNAAKAEAALGRLMGPVGPAVARAQRQALADKAAKEKAATTAAKAATPPVNFCNDDVCEKFKLMHAVGAIF